MINQMRQDYFEQITTDQYGKIGSKLSLFYTTLHEALSSDKTRAQFAEDYINYKNSLTDEDKKKHIFIHSSDGEIRNVFSSIFKEIMKENSTVQNEYGIMVPDTRPKEFKLILHMWLYTFH